MPELEIFCIVEPENAHVLEGTCIPTSRQIQSAQPGGLVRDSLTNRAACLEISPDLVFTLNYLTDPSWPAPFVFAIHDTVPFVHQDALSDLDVEMRYGRPHLQEIQNRVAEYSHPTLSALAPAFSDFTRRYIFSQQVGLAGKAMAILTPSTASERALESLYGRATPKMSSLIRRVRLRNQFSFLDRAGLEPVTEDDPYLVTILGSCHAHKQSEKLLRAFTSLRLSTVPNLVVVLSDTAPEWQMKAFSDTPGVRVATGLASLDLARLLAGADALVVSSSAEGYCLPAHEAAELGVPVIAPSLQALEGCLDGDVLRWDPDVPDTLTGAVASLRDRDRTPIALSEHLADDVPWAEDVLCSLLCSGN